MQKNKKILFIDDDEAIGELLSRSLRDTVWVVEFYEDYEDGRSAAIANPPDLLLLDYNLPNRQGFENLSNLREYAELAETPILLTSSIDLNGIDDKSIVSKNANFINKDDLLTEKLVVVLEQIVDGGFH